MTAQASPGPPIHMVGLDENGLGARLGPMLVTGVLARVTPAGRRWLDRKLPKWLARDLDDSKRLVSFGNAALGEAWARALTPGAGSPSKLVEAVSLTSERGLRARCPTHSEKQCWTPVAEHFQAEADTVQRVVAHKERMAQRGVELLSAKCEVLCTRRLNDEKEAGGNRFISDLHAMERLILAFADHCAAPLVVHCGKVGGMADYERYFGPLSGRLRTVLVQSKQESAYHFPGLGQVHFQENADAKRPLVMLASLVGKYLRELLMARISRFYASRDERLPLASGYHDPVTTRLIELSGRIRKKTRIHKLCFERVGARGQGSAAP